jgi:hypothetical protein
MKLLMFYSDYGIHSISVDLWLCKRKNSTVRFEVLTLVIMKDEVSEECSSSVIRVIRIGELGRMLAVTSNRRTLVAANIVPSPPILATEIMETLISCETSILTRATRRNIPHDGILHKIPLFNSPQNIKMRVPFLSFYSLSSKYAVCYEITVLEMPPLLNENLG